MRTAGHDAANSTVWVFIAFNLLMLWSLIRGMSALSSMPVHSDAERAGQTLGSAIGLTWLLTMWTLGDIVLGIFVLLTRGDRLVIEEAVDAPRPTGVAELSNWIDQNRNRVVGGVVVFFVATVFLRLTAADVGPTRNDGGPAMVAATAPAVAIPQPQAEVRLLGYHCSREYGFTTVQGEVRNISDAPISNLMVVASHYSSDGQFIRSHTGMVDYNPIMPGQTSPFRAMSTDNPMMSKCKVEFKRMFGGTVQVEK